VIPRQGRCLAPTSAKTADALAAYEMWKRDLLTEDGARGFLRVRRPNSSGAVVNSTVSEGIAYGMLAAVTMNDQVTFDRLWLYSQQFLDANGLMDWYIGPDGSRLGTGGASDSDEDMAFALLLADARWGGRGMLPDTYIATARRQIDLVWRFEVDHGRGDVLKPGDMFMDGSVINISYFAPAFYRAFGRATGQEANWNRVVEASYAAISRAMSAANGNADNGLVPAWSTPEGVPMRPSGTNHPIHHQLDSCRTPYRLAQDYCWNGEARALDYLRKASRFYGMIGARNITDGYNLDGTPRSEFASPPATQAASFVGPAAIAAMVGAEFAALRDEAYALVASLNLTAGSLYYQKSWTVLTVQMMAGLVDDPTLPR
jgi:endo-1,4-beta-D-glucanase Y